MPLDDETRARLRRIYVDRLTDPNARPVAYVSLDGQDLGWHGDELSPFVRTSPIDDYHRFHSVDPDAPVLVAQHLVKTTRGYLERVDALNTELPAANLPDRYLMVFDSKDPVVDGAVPIWTPVPIPSGRIGALVFGDQQLIQTNSGIVVALSTTPLTLTLTGAIGVFSGYFL